MSFLEFFGFVPSLSTFVSRLKQRLEEATDQVWTWEQHRGVLRRADPEYEIAVQNSYCEYRNAPRAARTGLLDKYVQIATAKSRNTPALWTLAARGIFPTVRSRHDFLVYRIEARMHDAPVMNTVARPITDHLEMRLVWDAGPSMAIIRREEIETWGQTEAAVWEIALGNLRALPKPTWVETESRGVFRLESEAGYEESHLLADRAIDALPFSSSAVLGVPNRGVLLAADGRDREAVLSLLEHIERSYGDRAWPLSLFPVERAANGWRTCASEDPAIADTLRRLARIDTAQLYADQKAALERLHEATDTDIFVATVQLTRRSESGPVESWCTWTEGVDTLIPETDLIAMLKPDVEGLLLPADIVRARFGSLMEATEEFPPRWRVREFPSTDVWAELRPHGEVIPISDT